MHSVPTITIFTFKGNHVITSSEAEAYLGLGAPDHAAFESAALEVLQKACDSGAVQQKGYYIAARNSAAGMMVVGLYVHVAPPVVTTKLEARLTDA